MINARSSYDKSPHRSITSTALATPVPAPAINSHQHTWHTHTHDHDQTSHQSCINHILILLSCTLIMCESFNHAWMTHWSSIMYSSMADAPMVLMHQSCIVTHSSHIHHTLISWQPCIPCNSSAAPCLSCFCHMLIVHESHSSRTGSMRENVVHMLGDVHYADWAICD